MVLVRLVMLAGASSGIGVYIAERLATLGSDVVMIARRKELLDKVAARCNEIAKSKGYQTRAIAMHADQGCAEDCERAVAECIKQFGRIDVLLIDAAAQMYDYFIDFEDPVAAARYIMEFGAIRLFKVRQAALPSLRERHGCVLQVSSLSGKAGTPWTSFYAASKAALGALYDSLRFEFEGQIDFCVAYPGFVATEVAVRHQGADRIHQAMDPDVCARKCLETAAGHYDERLLPLVGKVLLPVRMFLPWAFKLGVRASMPTREQHKKLMEAEAAHAAAAAAKAQ